MRKVFIILILLSGVTIGILAISGVIKNSGKQSEKFIEDNIHQKSYINNKSFCTGFRYPNQSCYVNCKYNIGSECDVNIFNRPP